MALYWDVFFFLLLGKLLKIFFSPNSNIEESALEFLFFLDFLAFTCICSSLRSAVNNVMAKQSRFRESTPCLQLVIKNVGKYIDCPYTSAPNIPRVRSLVPQVPPFHY